MKGLILIFSLFLSYGLSTEDEEKIQATSQLESIVLGSGCFWGEEKRYESIPGVVSAISGYADFKSKHQECSSIKVDDMLDILGSTKISGNVDFYGTVTCLDMNVI